MIVLFAHMTILTHYPPGLPHKNLRGIKYVYTAKYKKYIKKKVHSKRTEHVVYS